MNKYYVVMVIRTENGQDKFTSALIDYGDITVKNFQDFVNTCKEAAMMVMTNYYIMKVIIISWQKIALE